jgi:general stress protein YciG
MDPEQQRQIASMGGRAAHQRGTAHEWDSREAAEAGRKGGKAAHRRGVDSTESALENGRLGSRSEEANGSMAPRSVDAAMSVPDVRRESPGHSSWSENEYENRGIPGAGMANAGSSANTVN